MTEQNALEEARSALLAANSQVEGVASALEAQFKTEAEFANSQAYGTICRILGILEEVIERINEETTKSK